MSQHIVGRARDELGLSTARLAKRLGVSERTVWRWQHGEQGIPRPILATLELLLWLHRAGIDDPFGDRALEVETCEN